MDKQSPLLCYFEGRIVPLSEAKVGILTHAFSYGTGCFEGIRGYYNDKHRQLYLFRAREHFERLHESARVLMIDLKLTPDELVGITSELLRRSGIHQDAYVRPSAYKASEVIGDRAILPSFYRQLNADVHIQRHRPRQQRATRFGQIFHRQAAYKDHVLVIAV